MNITKSQKITDKKFNPARRDFAKAALGATLGGVAFPVSAGTNSATLRPIPPGIKLSQVAQSLRFSNSAACTLESSFTFVKY